MVALRSHYTKPFEGLTSYPLVMCAQSSVVRQKSLSFDCHSGLDPESSLSELDSRSPLKTCGDKLRGNDGSEMNVKKR
jgi:hypothetical protein